MPRVSPRLKQKRSGTSRVSNELPPKRKRAPRSRRASQVSTGVPSASTSSQPSGRFEFSDDVISRLADAVTQRMQQESTSTTTSTSSTPVVEGPVIATAVTSPPPPPVSTNQPPVVEVPNIPAQLASVHTSLVGPSTSTAPTSGELADPFVSSSLSIDARVTDKIRNKIWKHEYIDFGTLLVSPIKQNRYRISLSNTDDSDHDPALCLEPAEKPRKITTLDSWLSAFHIFVGVYTM